MPRIPEWLDLGWMREVWGPALAAVLGWLASSRQHRDTTQGEKETRLDTRQDKLVTTLQADNAELRTLLREERERADEAEDRADRAWEAGRRMESLAHSIRLVGNNRLMILAIEGGRPVPEPLPELPPLASLTKRPAA